MEQGNAVSGATEPSDQALPSPREILNAPVHDATRRESNGNDHSALRYTATPGYSPYGVFPGNAIPGYTSNSNLMYPSASSGYPAAIARQPQVPAQTNFHNPYMNQAGYSYAPQYQNPYVHSYQQTGNNTASSVPLQNQLPPMGSFPLMRGPALAPSTTINPITGPGPQSHSTTDISMKVTNAAKKVEAPQKPNRLPYEPSELQWNPSRTLNHMHKYCYCGDDRNLLDVDIECLKCHNFFHGRCIKLAMGPIVPFLSNYQFVCKHCNDHDEETFSRYSCSWKVACATTLANLMLMRLRMNHPEWNKAAYAAKNSETLAAEGGWYSRKVDMVPFLEISRHWDAICTDKDSLDSLWATKLGTALINNPDVFKSQDEAHRNANSHYCLVNSDLFAFKAGHAASSKSIGPRKRKAEEIESKQSAVKLERTKSTSEADSTQQTKDKEDQVYIPPERISNRVVVKPDEVPAFTPKIPTHKREFPAKSLSSTTKDIVRERKPTAKKAATVKRQDATPTKLIRRPPPYKPQDFHAVPKLPVLTVVEGQFVEGQFFAVSDIPYNKRGFRYIPCEAALDRPAIMYRQVEVRPHIPRIDWSDMSPYMYLSSDGRSATTDKGFRMGRANVGARVGQWYWEVKVLRGNGDKGGHVRLGVARREASIDGPVGFDAYSYGIRDRGGEKLHLSRPKPFMDAYGTGDVLGFHLSLPEHGQSSIYRDRIPIRYRQQLYFEQFEYTGSKDMEELQNPDPLGLKTSRLPVALKGSHLTIYKNGKRIGTAFENLWSFWPPNSQTQRDTQADDDGTLGYYPAISVYAGGAARFNFGPNFDFEPTDGLLTKGDVHAMQQRYDEQIAEDTLHDLLDELEFEHDLNELTDGERSLEVAPIREIAEYD